MLNTDVIMISVLLCFCICSDNYHDNNTWTVPPHNKNRPGRGDPSLAGDITFQVPCPPPPVPPAPPSRKILTDISTNESH